MESGRERDPKPAQTRSDVQAVCERVPPTGVHHQHPLQVREDVVSVVHLDRQHIGARARGIGRQGHH
jgi:hypothetical protein